MEEMNDIRKHHAEMRLKMDKQRLQRLIDGVKREIKRVERFAEDKNLFNSQEYLDFEDFLNEISVKDHSPEEVEVEEVEAELEENPEVESKSEEAPEAE